MVSRGMFKSALLTAALFPFLVLGIWYLLIGATFLPDPQHTPGATNPDVTPQTAHKTICLSGYTEDIRPPDSYTNKLKVKQLNSYYRGQGTPREVEEDHLIPLTVGGNPTDERNLWPQPRDGEHTAAEKDKCEVATNRLVCLGRVPLRTAQQSIAKDWVAWCRKIGSVK